MKKLSDKNGNLTVHGVARMFANPFYAINIDPLMCSEHEPIISEKKWIEAAMISIAENGVEEFLEHLLENLKGDCIMVGYDVSHSDSV